MNILHSIFQQSPEIALFLSLAFGYLIGKIKFGSFQLGGVAGSLLVAVIISLAGVNISDGLKTVLFILFIYAVGYESGPQFFSSLSRKTLREIILAIVLAVSALATVIICAKLFQLDKGLSAGIAAGALTQSAIIGTADAAIARLSLTPDQIQQLQSNVAVGYAVTYIFGSIGTIIICVNLLPKFMRRDLHEDAVKAEIASHQGNSGIFIDRQLAAPDLVGRVFQLSDDKNMTVSQLEKYGDPQYSITIERIKRGDKVLQSAPDLMLKRGDQVLIVGRRSNVLNHMNNLGTELPVTKDMEVPVKTNEMMLTNPKYIGKTIGYIKQSTAPALAHGIFVVSIKRNNGSIAFNDDTKLEKDDIIALYGSESDLQRVSSLVGPQITADVKTDLIYLSLGLVVGLLIGLLVWRIGTVPLTLGSGGGALLSGLLFGWYRSRHITIGNLPISTSTFLRDFGLAGFVAAVGLQSGAQAIKTVASDGLSIFLIGAVVTIVPLIITMLIGRYVLKYDNVAVFAGALSGSRSANPAFGEILDKAGNSVPTVSFAVTYALANVFLTLLGPLIVAMA